LKLAQATYDKMVQNLWWASGYHILAILVAAGVLIAVNARFLDVEQSAP